MHTLRAAKRSPDEWAAALSLSERAAAISAVVAPTGWRGRVGVVDLDPFSPDGAADVQTDLQVAARLIAALCRDVACRKAFWGPHPPGAKGGQLPTGPAAKGAHGSPHTMLRKVRNLGINILGARNSALQNLVREIPPPVVAHILGYSHCTQHHARLAAQPCSRYVISWLRYRASRLLSLTPPICLGELHRLPTRSSA